MNAGGNNGFAPSAVARVYDPVADCWVQIADMPSPGGAMGVGNLSDGRALLVSFSASGGSWNALAAYDPVADSWEEIPLPPLTYPPGSIRAGVTASILSDGGILFLQGPYDILGIDAEAWVYTQSPQ